MLASELESDWEKYLNAAIGYYKIQQPITTKIAHTSQDTLIYFYCTQITSIDPIFKSVLLESSRITQFPLRQQSTKIKSMNK